MRVAPPDDSVFVTLLAGGEQGSAGAAVPGGADALPEIVPEAVAPPAAPVPLQAVSPARRVAPPAPSPARRPEERRAPPAERSAERIALAPPAEAGAPGSAASAAAGGAATGIPVAALAPGAGGAGAVDASRVYGEGEVDRAAAPVGGIRRPEYPARERMLGREGRVSLTVTVDAGGAVREVAVARSGGDAFDRSARRAVEATPFRAARLADQPVTSTVTVDVSFELD